MDKIKKQYVKPEINVIDVKLEPILSGSAYPTDGGGYGGWFD